MFPKQRPISSTNGPRPDGNEDLGLRNPPWDNTTYILILVVVLVPIIFTLILCTITYCIYRYNKKRTDRTPTNAAIIPTDPSGIGTARIIYNTQHSPFIIEDLPPSYDSLAYKKKDLNNTTEHIQLTELPSTNENVTTAAAILPTAPSPPPSYASRDEINKQ